MKRIIAMLFVLALLSASCGRVDQPPQDSSAASESTESSESSSVIDDSSDTSEFDDSSTPDESGEASGGDTDEDKKEEPLELIIGGVHVSENNASDVFGDGTVRVETDPTGNDVSVYLKDADFLAAPNPESTEIESVNGIYCNKTLTLYLEGENRISIKVPDIDYFYCFGIRTDYKEHVYMHGDGSLEIVTIGDGSACEVVGIQTGYLGVHCRSLDVDINATGFVDGIYALDGVMAGHHDHIAKITVNAETDSTDDTAFGVYTSKLSASHGCIDVRGYSPAPEQTYTGTSTSSFKITYWDAPSVHADHDGEILLRGNASVCYGNYFTIDEAFISTDEESYYSTQRVYVSDDENGKNAYEAEVIHDECPEAFKKPYVRITEGSRDDYGVWICGKRITAGNASDVLGDGTVKYDPTSRTLTLNGTVLSGGGLVDNHFSNSEAVIFAADSLNILLVGSSELTCSSNMAASSTALEVDGILTVSGDGSITLKSSEARGVYGTSVAISCHGYRQESGNVTAIAAGAQENTAEAGSYGIITTWDYFYFYGGTLYAESADSKYSHPLMQNGAELSFDRYENATVETGTTDGGRYIRLTEII